MKYDDTLDPDFFDNLNFDEELVGENDKNQKGKKGGGVNKAKGDNKDKQNETKSHPEKKERMGEDLKDPLTEDEDLDSDFDIYGEE